MNKSTICGITERITIFGIFFGFLTFIFIFKIFSLFNFSFDFWDFSICLTVFFYVRIFFSYCFTIFKFSAVEFKFPGLRYFSWDGIKKPPLVDIGYLPDAKFYETFVIF